MVPPTVTTLSVFAMVVVMAANASSLVHAQAPKDSGPAVVSMPDFVMPEDARAAGIDGVMRFSVSLDETGVVKDARLLAGPAWPCKSRPETQIEKVRTTARYNILAARFTPMVKNGEAKKADFVFDFKIGTAYKDAVKRRHAASGALSRAVDAGLVEGRALSLAAPIYPVVARQNSASGAVQVWVLIDEAGKVERAGAMNGHQLLQDPARDAACGAKYSPTTIQGQPIKTAGMISYNFRP